MEAESQKAPELSLHSPLLPWSPISS